MSLKKCDNVSKLVTPNVTLAGTASGLIQNEIHDIMTIKHVGMYVWNRQYPRRRRNLNITSKQVKLPKIVLNITYSKNSSVLVT